MTPRLDHIRIYSLDITERKQMEAELRRSRDELEIRVQERTAELSKAYQKLKEQTKILEAFFSSTVTPLVFLDRNFNFVRVNEAYAKACQRDVSEFPGHNHFEFYPSDAKAIFEQVVQTREPYQAIARPFSFPDHPEWGETYWNWNLTPILDDRVEVEFLVFSLEDVTKRKRAEEAVEAERQRFNDVLEILPAYLVLLTPDYHVPFANRFFRERFGEAYGRRCFEYLFGRSEPCEICETYTVLKTMEPHQWEWTGPDGRNYSVFDFPFTDTDGSTLVLEMGIDITERKRAEEALKAASLYTRSLIEASLDPLVTISPDGKVTDVNRATEQVTGVSREDLIGTDFSNYFTEPEKAQQGYRQVFSEGFVKDYPLAIRHISGRVTDVLYHATVYKNEVGEIQGVFAAARDITVRKGLQRRIEATNALLNLFVRMPSRKEYLDAALELIQNWSGCRCAGIRVLDRQGHIPYESYSGFSREFWESENFLSVEKDQCACIRVVTGELDSQDLPVVTPGGSFCCANTIEFLEGLSEGEKSRYRGVCIQNGFLSVAIVPVRYREQIIGAIHVADEGEGKVALKSIEFMESMAPLIGEAVNRFHLEEEIRDSETRLRHLSSELLTVQESERKRIGREIHDGIGQTLAAIKFALESKLGQMRGGAASPEASIENIISLAQNGIEESRRIQMDLRPSILDDLGILPTLSWFTREFQKVYSHISIEKEIDIQENEVPDSLRIALFRVIQEALNNTAKHSKADLVRLSLGKKEDKIELNIEDNGMGFDLENYRKGLGLTSMRERTELSGGSFAIESTPGKGTIIRACWPISMRSADCGVRS
jgi:PAS domain S-box-containing protein